MTNELDTSWFDLKNYEMLKTMPIEGWIWQLEARYHYHRLKCDRPMDHDNEAGRFLLLEADRLLLSIANELKAGIIPENSNYPHERHNWRAGAILEGHSFSTASVDSLTSYDLWKMAKNKDLSHVWDACEHDHVFFLDDCHNDELSEIAHTPYDFHISTALPPVWLEV